MTTRGLHIDPPSGHFKKTLLGVSEVSKPSMTLTDNASHLALSTQNSVLKTPYEV
ncbi:MAG: hypothetical protein SFY66_24580 [Oculatellaceae cyanobacterium bins.114]|nr:hypothetical protein [Oculatellaceae cyanobacterium bins.114]